MKKKVSAIAICLLLISINLFPRGNHQRESEFSLPVIYAIELRAGEKLEVVATTSIIADVISNVGGNTLGITVLIGVGQDPHGYQPTPSALAAIERAHIVFTNGFGLEESLLTVIDNAATGAVVPLSVGIEPINSNGDDQSHSMTDPHVWFDPTNVVVWTKNINNVLSEADPKNQASYQAGAESYIKQLELLDEKIQLRTSSLPSEKRKLVTDHRMFAYFADEYGYELIGSVLPSPSTSGETSPRQLSNLVKVLRKEKMATLFVGTTAGHGLEKLAATLAQELGEQITTIALLTRSLSQKGAPGDTYIGYMEYNVDQIIKGLARQE